MDLIPTATLSTDFPSIAQATDLLNHMERASFPCGQPSDDMVAFLDRIENTDPNSPDISDDDKNAAWGHYQFTASSLTCRSVLSSWSSVGNVNFACRLIAAAIKTSRVARHICHLNQLKPTSFLSDIYLSNIIELLWELCKDIDNGVSQYKYDSRLHY
jgi:hypothetical protein